MKKQLFDFEHNMNEVLNCGKCVLNHYGYCVYNTVIILDYEALPTWCPLKKTNILITSKK